MVLLNNAYCLRALIAGLLLPFGFAPFHLPGLSILGLALLFAQLRQQTRSQSFWSGFIFGIGFLGLGVSWVYVSIHHYGHLNVLISLLITSLFIVYLALFTGLVALLYHELTKTCSLLLSCCLFSALWCLGEYARSNFFSGFPWLLIGFGQIDAPLKYLLPIIGVYGVGFLTSLAASFLVGFLQENHPFKRYLWLVACVGLLTAPSLLKMKQWTKLSNTPLSVGIIQANLSMRDKWDESLFWQLLEHYQQRVEPLMGKKQLIVLPESAIPLPENYVNDFLETMNQKASLMGSAILLGIPQPVTTDSDLYYNTLMTLGKANGLYFKQHLVPFGEYIPQPFAKLMTWLDVPMANLQSGKRQQPLIQVHHHPVAALICYELAYPSLLRHQMPEAEWIVSISDDGWFGQSFAIYQQLQMAQVLSVMTGRFQVVSNNDGLSSIIDREGTVLSSLPAFRAGVLEGDIYPASGSSPWTDYGDAPILFFCLIIVLLSLLTLPIAAKHKRRYPYQPN
jgi:apolipoprotein N-acyltransferase